MPSIHIYEYTIPNSRYHLNNFRNAAGKLTGAKYSTTQSLDTTTEPTKLTGKEKLQAKKEKKNALPNNKSNTVLPADGGTTRQRLHRALENVGDASKAKLTLPSNRKQRTLHKFGKALGLKTVFFKTTDPDTRINGFTYPGMDEPWTQQLNAVDHCQRSTLFPANINQRHFSKECFLIF